MNFTQPMSLHHRHCVGFVASGTQRAWLSVPCDQKFPTLVMCHHQLQKAKEKHQHSHNVMCPHGWFKWTNICVQFTYSSAPEGRNMSCASTVEANPHKRLKIFKQLLHHAKWRDLIKFAKSKDKHLMFILRASYVVNSQYLCIRPSQDSVQQCSSEQFQCSDGGCIPLAFQCSNIADCMDGLDEVDCSWTCTHMPCTKCLLPHCHCINDFYQCESGGCIPVDAVCDGTKNCADDSDERYCELICRPNFKPCSDGLLCVADEHWCDGIQHCIDGTDELCHYDDCVGFLCYDACIPAAWNNDGITDCMYGEDETQYRDIKFDSGTCEVENYLPCDTHSGKHCYPVTHHCLYETEYTGVISFCRRGKHLTDCADFICSSTYKCPGAYCIPFGQLCDGNIDCPDGEDERMMLLVSRIIHFSPVSEHA